MNYKGPFTFAEALGLMKIFYMRPIDSPTIPPMRILPEYGGCLHRKAKPDENCISVKLDFIPAEWIKYDWEIVEG